MYNVSRTGYFVLTAKKFINLHPEMKNNIADIMRKMERDPFNPEVRIRPLKGVLQGLGAVSIMPGCRLTFALKSREKKIILLDIGNHDET